MLTEGKWNVRLHSNSIIIQKENKDIGEYVLLTSTKYCEKCAYPRPTQECPWHWNDAMDRTYAIGIYYPRRRVEHKTSLLSKHIIELKLSREYAIPLGLSMALLARTIYKELLDKVDIITFVPKHYKEYKRDRVDGAPYNQAEELARMVGW